MKSTVGIAAFAGCASAFMGTAPMPGMQRSSTRSASLPSLRMQSVVGKGKGSMVGDKGFDPLKCATSIEKLRIYREAELKHGRLAMLAAAGWPLSEALDKPLAEQLGMKALLVGTPGGGVDGEALLFAPSVLNGGLDAVSPIFWGGIVLFSFAAELYLTSTKKQAGVRSTLAALGVEDLTGIDLDGDGQVGTPTLLKDDKYMPGNLGFDPLGLFKGTDAEKRTMQMKEINNGRLAMVAITAFAIKEAAIKLPVFPGN